MANKRIDMKKLRAAIRLYEKGHSKRSIAQSCGLSKTTINKYISTYKGLGLDWLTVKQLNEQELLSLFSDSSDQDIPKRLHQLRQFFPYMHRELRKTGVTRRLLWEEYIDLQPDGYRISQFCEHYSRWNKRITPVMHIEYKAGDKMLVDYCGKKLSVVNAHTGQVDSVEVFVAILGASQLIYVQACASQKKQDFILCCENALCFYGGVPQAIVTDNLKSAVTRSHRYEPVLNADFADFCEHYETAGLPTRAYKPKDKALVESAVRITYQHIYARIRSEVFNSLDQLNRGSYKIRVKSSHKRISCWGF